MTAFRHYHESSIRNGCRHLFGPIWRCKRIAVPDKNESRHDYGRKARATIDPYDNGLRLPRQSIDANRKTHPHIHFAKGRIVLVRRMQYRAQSLCQQRLEITGPSLGDQSPAPRDLFGGIRAGRGVEQRQFNHTPRRLPYDLAERRRGLRRPSPGLFYPPAWMRW